MAWSDHELDGGLLRFDRDTGVNVLLRGPGTQRLARRAPRSLQIGLLTPCNLSCSFCYRDTRAPSRLTAPFLLDLLQRASTWGVLEAAFGGGEPLLFKGFVPLLRELHATTRLGLGFTTNGVLLDDDVVAALDGVVGEIRLSAYEDNRYRRTLRRLRRPVGVNLLVTPRNVTTLEPVVHDALALGARNVLLLGYKGPRPELHLTEDHLRTLTRSLARMSALPLRLDVCWYPALRGVDHLFERDDCGAGDEILVIAPDRAIQPCSFHHERIPFDTFEDLVRIYGELRARRPAAEVRGCTRDSFSAKRSLPMAVEEARAWVWHARASNNSGDWTIAARFCSHEEARRAAEALRELARAHEAFLASPEGQRWIEQHGYDGSVPTPPLRHFGEAHGFDWSEGGDGLWWEEDGFGAPVLTAGAVGDAVVVYHPYCMGLPEGPFRAFFERCGALEMGLWDYGRPHVVVRAKGRNSASEKAMEDYLALVHAADDPWAIEAAPPWGDETADPRVSEDEDRSARLAHGNHSFFVDDDGVSLSLAFQNTFAGSVAVERWLREGGFTEIGVEIDAVLSPLQQPAAASTPRTGLFGDVRPLAVRLPEASEEQLVEWLFRAGRLSEPFAARLEPIRPERIVALATARAREYWTRGLDVTEVITGLAQRYRGAMVELVRELWRGGLTSPLAPHQAIPALAAALPAEEAFVLAAEWARAAADPAERGRRIRSLARLESPRVLELVEEHLQDPAVSVTSEWGRIAVASRLDWATARRWIEHGRPLSLVALDALSTFCDSGAHADFGPPDLATLRAVLERYAEHDPVPRVTKSVSHLLRYPAPLAHDAEGI